MTKELYDFKMQEYEKYVNTKYSESELKEMEREERKIRLLKYLRTIDYKSNECGS